MAKLKLDFPTIMRQISDTAYVYLVARPIKNAGVQVLDAYSTREDAEAVAGEYPTNLVVIERKLHTPGWRPKPNGA